MFVRPAKADDQIPMPEGGYLPRDGKPVPMTSYWCRLVRDGQVIEGKLTRKTKSKEI